MRIIFNVVNARDRGFAATFLEDIMGKLTKILLTFQNDMGLWAGRMVRTGTISGIEGIRRTNGRMKRKVGRMKSRCWDD